MFYCSQDQGGMITLTDAYCRVNRARGFELLSPEDLLNACNNFTSEPNIPLCLHTFETTGVAVIQLVNASFCSSSKSNKLLQDFTPTLSWPSHVRYFRLWIVNENHLSHQGLTSTVLALIPATGVKSCRFFYTIVFCNCLYFRWKVTLEVKKTAINQIISVVYSSPGVNSIFFLIIKL